MIEQLKLYDSKLQKVRLGNPYDGGYIVALQALCRSSCLFSYGVNHDISFEIDYIEATNKKAFCFDHTTSFEVPIQFENKIILMREGLSAFKEEKTDNFLNHYTKYAENFWDNFSNEFSEKVLLKMDVEGCEYDFFKNVDMQALANVTTGMMIEFHWIYDERNRNSFFECLSKINQHFYLCHLHGNNNAEMIKYFERIPAATLNESYIEQFLIPGDLELTFINKELLKEAKQDSKKYPCSFLDRRNHVGKEECDLSFLRRI